MRNRNGLLLAFWLILICTNPAFSSCNDTGSSWACPGGAAANWRYYDSGSTSLWNENSCSVGGQDCNCGNIDAGGPCSGCTYQGSRTGGDCWDSNDCSSTGCTPVPQFASANIKTFSLLLSIFVAIGFSFYRKKNA